VSKRATSEVGFWVTVIVVVLFAVAMGASFPWGSMIVAVVVAVVAFQMGRKVGKLGLDAIQSAGEATPLWRQKRRNTHISEVMIETRLGRRRAFAYLCQRHVRVQPSHRNTSLG
jgi:hypothetical protein